MSIRRCSSTAGWPAENGTDLCSLYRDAVEHQPTISSSPLRQPGIAMDGRRFAQISQPRFGPRATPIRRRAWLAERRFSSSGNLIPGLKPYSVCRCLIAALEALGYLKTTHFMEQRLANSAAGRGRSGVWRSEVAVGRRMGGAAFPCGFLRAARVLAFVDCSAQFGDDFLRRFGCLGVLVHVEGNCTHAGVTAAAVALADAGQIHFGFLRGPRVRSH